MVLSHAVNIQNKGKIIGAFTDNEVHPQLTVLVALYYHFVVADVKYSVSYTRCNPTQVKGL